MFFIRQVQDFNFNPSLNAFKTIIESYIQLCSSILAKFYIFCWQGVLSSAIPWKVLQHQYSGNDVYEKEIKDLIESPESVSEHPYLES